MTIHEALLREFGESLGSERNMGYIGFLEAKITELREALDWYADTRTWNQWLPDSAGDRARRALAAPQKPEG
jgi:hypothetical protein